MPEEKFNLPNSSFNEVEKIIKGYAHLGESCNLTALAKLLGTGKTTVSPNNPFLVQVGLIQGGRDKYSTPLGTKLGRALDHNQEADIKASWKEVVKGSEFLSVLITTVRLKGGLTDEELATHIVYVSGEKNSPRTRTGARTVVDIIKQSGLLNEENGKFQVAAPTAETVTEKRSTQNAETIQHEPAEAVPASVTPNESKSIVNLPSLKNIPQININIQLQLPETENTAVYESLFKALRENLLDPKSNDSES